LSKTQSHIIEIGLYLCVYYTLFHIVIIFVPILLYCMKIIVMPTPTYFIISLVEIHMIWYHNLSIPIKLDNIIHVMIFGIFMEHLYKMLDKAI